jgi:beta-glucanase (GH16 family)
MFILTKNQRPLITSLLSLSLLLILPTLAHAAKWKLVWNDEFTQNGLPDTTKWNYEVGFVRNNEKQYYTKARLENARVEDGMLVIEGRHEKYPNAQYVPGSKNWNTDRSEADYTSASLTTRGKADWKYGRIEVRAALPHGKGVWPAIWLLGTKKGWPAGGEIDIMEYVGHDPKRIHTTVHFGESRASLKSKGAKKSFPGQVNSFHVYAMEWYPDRMDFFFDDEKYFTYNLNEAGPGEDNPFRNPQYLILNLALGGSWGREIDDSNLPQQFKIDYVRVYQFEE